MKYRCFCHPSLPQNAFQPRGARVGRPAPFVYGMTLEGGGCGIPIVSCVVNTVSCWVCGAAQTIGCIGAQICNSVQSAVPGGWGGVAATAAAIGAAVLTDGASLAACTAIDSTDVALGGSGGGGAFTATAGSGADFTVPAATADAGTAAVGDTASTLGSLTDPSLTTSIGDTASTGTFGSINPASTGTVGSLNASIPAGAMVGDGTAGTIMGQTYLAAGPGQFALNAFGQPILASSVGLCGIAAGTGSNIGLKCISNAARAANTLKNIFSGTPTAATKSGAKVATIPSTTSTGTVATTAPLSSTTPTGINALPAGTMKGSTLSLPMENSNINVASENMPSYNPLSLQEIQNAANGGLMSLASGGSTTLPINSEVNIPIETYSAPATNPQSLQEIQSAKTGGQMVHHFVEGGGVCTPVRGPGVLHGSQTSFNQAPHGLNPIAGGVAGQYSVPVFKKAEGGGVHVPDFYSEGGLKHTYVKGAGDGTSDSIPAMLANGEFVIPADVVSSLGNGDNDSGAHVLDEFLRTIREHKRKADANHLPPDSKGALGYLLEAKKKVKK